MATAASPSNILTVQRQQSLPKEDANFLRLFLLINKVGTQVCYDIFHRYFSTNKHVLYQQLLPYKKILKPFLFQSQFDLIYGDPNQETDSSKFDITLLLLLIRKTCPLLAPPKKGWNRRPSQSDISEGANLERLRNERNLLAHAGDNKLDVPTFNKRWNIAEIILVSLGACLAEVNDYKTKPLDETYVNMEEELSILHDLLIQHIDVSFTKYSENEQKISLLEDQISTMQKRLHSGQPALSNISSEDVQRRLQTTYLRNESIIPCIEWDVNNKGFFQLDEIFIEPRIHEWKPQRSSHTNQKGFLTIYELFEKHKHVPVSACIFSDPGRGKSVLMKKLAVDYAQNNGTFKTQLPDISFVLLIKCKDLLEYDSLEEYIEGELIRDSNTITKKVMAMMQQSYKNCLFLVDGLDEIMHVDKSQSVDDLYNLLKGKSHCDASIIATSRPSGLKTMEKQFSLFRELYIISPLEDDDIQAYIGKYFSEKDDGYCQRVFEHLTNDNQIRELVSSPLTLSIVCNIYDDADGPVPHSITNLYHQLVQQMIQKFKNYHGFVSPGEGKKQGTRRVSECLLKSVGFVAFQSLKSGNEYFEHQELVNYLVAKQKRSSIFAKAKRWLSGLNPTSVLQLGFITADTGTNPRKLNLRYQFEPKMCQKYIAAEYIVNQLLRHGFKKLNELLGDDGEGQVPLLRTNHELCLFIVDSLGRRGEKGLCKELFNNLFKDFGSL